MISQRLLLASLTLMLSGCGSVSIAWSEWIGPKDPGLADLEDLDPELARQVKMGVLSMDKPGADYGNSMSPGPSLDLEDRLGKAFVTHRPLSEVLEIKLPGRVVESCLLMSGRHLLMISKNPSSMFVLEPEKKRISSLLNLADSCKYAAGGNRLVSYEASADKFVIYTLPGFKAERSHPSPFSEKILALGMGWGNPNLLWVFVQAGEQTHIYIGDIDRFDFKQVNSIDKSKLYSHQIPGRKLLLGDMTGRRMVLSGQLICLLGENEYEQIQRSDRPILITANRLLVGYHGLRLFNGSMSIEQPLLLSPSGRLYMTFDSKGIGSLVGSAGSKSGL
jgi:hypothetical protein